MDARMEGCMAKRCPVCGGKRTDCWACGGSGVVDPGAVRAAIEGRARAMEARKRERTTWEGLRPVKCSSR